MTMTDPLSLTQAKRLASNADTLLLRATRSADLETPIGAFLRLDDGSTPAYRPVLAMHGWAELGRELNYVSRGTEPDRWERMGELVDDEVLAAFAVVAEPDQLGPALVERYGDIVDRFSFYTPYEVDDAALTQAIETLRAT